MVHSEHDAGMKRSLKIQQQQRTRQFYSPARRMRLQEQLSLKVLHKTPG
jgi:hypothetical protein